MNKNWNDKADKDLFFTILSVKNIGVISGSEWVTIGTHMRSLGYGFTNEGCRQHFQGLRRAQAKAENGLANGSNPRRIDPTLDPITRRPGPGRGRPRKQPAAAGDAANVTTASTTSPAPGQAGDLAATPNAAPPPPPPPHAVGAPGTAQLHPGPVPPPPPGAAAPPPHPASHMQGLPPGVQLHPQYPSPHVLTAPPHHPYAVPGGGAPGGASPHHPLQPQSAPGAPKPYMPPPPAQASPVAHPAGPAQISHPGSLSVGMVPQVPMTTEPDGLPGVVGHEEEEDDDGDEEDGHEPKRQKLEPSADGGQENAAAGTSAEDEAVLTALAAHNGGGNHPPTSAEYPTEYTYGDV
ncbi:hypothetical protein VTJ83DRAFT_6661 [Remersonia thermophila]|uniref:Myb-like domain-containing protein n=1 Tax=Remersonia thermophila TaxID=72144 RepID=A0ABR4D5C0_9PEZI